MYRQLLLIFLPEILRKWFPIWERQCSEIGIKWKRMHVKDQFFLFRDTTQTKPSQFTITLKIQIQPLIAKAYFSFDFSVSFKQIERVGRSALARELIDILFPKTSTRP